MHKILLVEDDKLIRDELETLLVNAGFSVRSVEDFDNTLEHIREEMPDLLLLDINLPGQNGLGKVPQKGSAGCFHVQRSGQAQVFRIQPAVRRDCADPGNDSQR